MAQEIINEFTAEEIKEFLEGEYEMEKTIEEDGEYSITAVLDEVDEDGEACGYYRVSGPDDIEHATTYEKALKLMQEMQEWDEENSFDIEKENEYLRRLSYRW